MTVNVLRRARIRPEKAVPEAARVKILQYVNSAVPEKHKIATQRVLLGQLPRSAAIKIKCLQCCNYDRDEVRNCPAVSCALHPVRPYATRAPKAPDEHPAT